MCHIYKSIHSLQPFTANRHIFSQSLTANRLLLIVSFHIRVIKLKVPSVELKQTNDVIFSKTN